MDLTPVHLTVKSHPESLKQIRTLTARVAKQMNLPEKETGNIVLAVDEVCSNIMRHGYADDRSRDIHLTILPDPDELIIQVADSGVPFDINSATPRNPCDVKPGGLGIYIIKQVMDRVEYGKTNTGLNQTRLIKKL